jgi:hypothetical protein
MLQQIPVAPGHQPSKLAQVVCHPVDLQIAGCLRDRDGLLRLMQSQQVGHGHQEGAAQVYVAVG